MLKITNEFKTTMSTQYKVIKTLLGRNTAKGGKAAKTKAQWERYALYIFCLLMRIRNCKNFVWWAICNAASDYGGGGNKLPLFFGVAVASTTMLKHLNSFNKKKSLTKRTIETLSPMAFAVSTFDNSQMITQKH